MSQIGPVPIFRYLARMPRARLAITYVLAATTATTLYDIGRYHDIHGLRLLGALLGLVSFSIFITVTTWYRNDQLPQATFLLSVTTALSWTAGVIAAVLAGGASVGVGALVLTGSILGLPIRILILTIIFAILIGVGRHFRQYFAPQTLTPNEKDRRSAA